MEQAQDLKNDFVFTRKKANGQAKASVEKTAVVAQPVTAATTAAYRHGSVGNRVAYVGSAPGRHEEAAGAPFSGRSGQTLQKLTVALNKAKPADFPATSKDEVCTFNAYSGSLYGSRDGRSEAKKSEILTPSNIAQTKARLADIDTAITLGAKATALVRATGYQGRIVEAPHPSLQCLSRKFKSDKATPQARAEDRDNQFIETVLQQI